MDLVPKEALDHPKPFIMDSIHAPEWTIYLPGHIQYKGANARAEELGYQIQYFLCLPDANARALSNNLYHRGIQGVMLSPIFESKFIDTFDWEKFACVSIADHYYLPPTDFVVPKLSSHIMLVFSELFRRGYRRPGIVLYHERIQHLNNHTLRGVFLSLCETVGILADVPSPCYIEHKDLPKLKEWVELEKPDVVIGFNDFVYDTLREFGYRIPEDISFVSLATKDPKQLITGVEDPDFMMGYNGIDVIHQKLRHGVIGTHETRMFHTIQSKWIRGSSLPKKSEDTKQEAMANKGFADFMEIFPELKKLTVV